MEEAKSSVGSLELPTGIVIENEIHRTLSFREMSGAEEDLLASQSLSASQKFTQIFANCALKLGTIENPVHLKKAMEQLIVIDRWSYLIALRCLSLGSSYKFETKCAACGHLDKIIIDLNDLKSKKAPLATQLIQETALPSGRTIRWKVADGATEDKIEKMAKSNPNLAVTIGLFCRCLELDSKPASLADIKQMSLKDRTHWKKAIDENEGDFDDEYQTVCPACGHEYKGSVDLDGQNFFYP